MRKYENVSIDKLKPYERNARMHSAEQVDKIAKSIEEFGFINPVLIDGDFGIIAGHGRDKQETRLGYGRQRNGWWASRERPLKG